MSRLDKLIKEKCPNGVKFIELGKVCEITKGRGLSKSDKSTGDIPIILYGELYTTYGNYIDRIVSSASEIAKKSLLITKNDLLLPVSSTTKEAQIGKASVYRVEDECYLGGDAIRLRHEQNPGFLMYVINSTYFEKQKMKCVSGTTINHLSPSKLSKIKIPVPPLEVQNEIVQILDNFAELTAELTAELSNRKKQYEYYRNLLLNFDKNEERERVRWLTIGEIGGIRMCKRILKSQNNSVAGIPFYKIGTFGGVANSYISEETFEEYKEKYSFPKKGDVLISAAGTIGRTVIYDGEPAYFQDSNIVWLEHDESLVLNKYLYYYYQLSPWQISTGGTIARLYNDNILKTKIAVPSIDEQKRIIHILDNFSVLASSISEGLPAEIEAREKQYTYYRDKLLSFKELVPNA